MHYHDKENKTKTLEILTSPPSNILLQEERNYITLPLRTLFVLVNEILPLVTSNTSKSNCLTSPPNHTLLHPFSVSEGAKTARSGLVWWLYVIYRNSIYRFPKGTYFISSLRFGIRNFEFEEHVRSFTSRN